MPTPLIKATEPPGLEYKEGFTKPLKVIGAISKVVVVDTGAALNELKGSVVIWGVVDVALVKVVSLVGRVICIDVVVEDDEVSPVKDVVVSLSWRVVVCKVVGAPAEVGGRLTFNVDLVGPSSGMASMSLILSVPTPIFFNISDSGETSIVSLQSMMELLAETIMAPSPSLSATSNVPSHNLASP